MTFNLLKPLLIISFCLFFLPAFALPVKIGNFCPTVFFVFSVIFIVFCLIFYNKLIINNIKLILQYKCAKFLLLYFVFVTLSSLLYILIGRSNITALLSVLIRFLIYVLPFFISFMLARYLQIKTTFKLIYTIIVFIIFWGIFDYIIFYFDIKFLEDIFYIIVNKRLITRELFITKVYSGIFPRVQSVFEEPCHIGAFLTALIPMIIFTSNSKYKIYKSTLIDKFLKSTIPILTIIILFATLSPIYIILGLSVFVFYYCKYKLKLVFKYKFYYLLFILLFLLISYFFTILMDEFHFIFIERIKAVFLSFKSIDLLIEMEPSLGRRIIDIINMFILFAKNPIMGVGYNNLFPSLYNQINIYSPVPLTEEVYFALSQQAKYIYLPTPNIFFIHLAESGLLGIIPLYCFFIYSYKAVSNILPLLMKTEASFIYGIREFILLYILLSFYDSQLQFPYGLALMGAGIGIIYQIRQRKVNYENNNC